MERVNAEDFTWIDLDEPAPWWRSLVVIAVVAALVTVLVAPWFISLENEQPNVTLQSNETTNSYCRPSTDGVPNLLNPSLASWSRFCEWFLEPNVDTTIP